MSTSCYISPAYHTLLYPPFEILSHRPYIHIRNYLANTTYSTPFKHKNTTRDLCLGRGRIQLFSSVRYFFSFLFFAWCNADVSFSVKTNLTDSSSLAKHAVFKTLSKRNILGKIFEVNTRFCIIIYVLLMYTTLCIWTCNLLLLSGDIHPNPGAASTASTFSFSSSQETVLSFSPTDLNLTNLANHLSFVHYNVQSLRLKLDLIAAELCDFDILAFSETLLNPSVSITDLIFSLIGNLSLRTEKGLVMGKLFYM